MVRRNFFEVVKLIINAHTNNVKVRKKAVLFIEDLLELLFLLTSTNIARIGFRFSLNLLPTFYICQTTSEFVVHESLTKAGW